MPNVQVTGNLKAPRSGAFEVTLDGKLVVFDHDVIDIVIDPETKKVITFGKIRFRCQNINLPIFDVRSSYRPR